MIKFKHHDDTFKQFPRTLMEAFPEAPQWHKVTPLHEVVLYLLGFFVVCFLGVLFVMGG